MVVDRARGTTPQPDTEPAAESSPEPPGSARRDSTGSGETASRTAPAARSDQPGNPQHATGPANGNKKSTVTAPPGQQQEKKNNGNGTAGAEKDNTGNSDDVDDLHSDTTKQQQKAGPE